MFGFDLGKYRTIVVSIALFLVLDLGVLVLNFVISSEIDKDAVNINLAGRQRMLSQRMAKTSLQIEARTASGAPYEKEAKELQQAHATFDGTLNAFIAGGTTLLLWTVGFIVLLLTTAAYLSGVYGAFGKAASSGALLAAALMFEAVALVPALQLKWALTRAGRRAFGVAPRATA